jgi:lipopolysaccharide export system protein LptA
MYKNICCLCFPALTIVVFGLCFTFQLKGQTASKIELVNAKTLEYNEQIGKNVRRLIGEVIFKHDNVLMYCDSAHLFGDQNKIDAFGNVRINQGDTMNLKGEILHYDGNQKTARMSKNVVLTDQKMILETELLLYNLKQRTANYPNGGKILDGENRLESSVGYYFTESKDFYFRDNVIVTHPDYKLEADTLKYNHPTQTVFFLGPTRIIGTDAIILTERGWYNSHTGFAKIHQNARILSESRIISADTLNYNRNTRTGNALLNVTVHDTLEKVIVSGEIAEFLNNGKTLLVYKEPQLTVIFGNDSLFLHADTLNSTYDSTDTFRILKAFHGVRFYKNDLQGVCDSLVYNYRDSLIQMFTFPILWSSGNQLTGTSIDIQIALGKIHALHIPENSFITSLEDTGKFNQIKGRIMEGFFENNKLYKISVNGNGQAIYYAKNKNNETIGVNRAVSSDMLIFTHENKVQKVTLLNSPEATLYPDGELTPEELMLKGFNWLENLRPINKNDIFSDRNQSSFNHLTD